VLALSHSSSLRARFQAGIFWNAVAAVATQGSTFLANLFIANLLGRDGFGEFSIVYTTVLAAAGIAQVATGITATKYVAEFRDVEKERAGRVLGLCSLVSLVGGIVATILVMSLASWLAGHVLNAPHVVNELAVAAGFILFSAANGYQQGALAGFEGYRRLARISIGVGVVHVGSVVLATYWWGFVGAVTAIVASAVIRWVLFNIALRAEADRWGIVIRYREALSERTILHRFAVPAAIAGLSTMPAVWLSNVFLAQQPGGYGQVGLFSAANNLRNLVLFLPALTNNVGQALLNNQKGRRDQARYTKVFWANTAATAALLLVASAVVAIFGKLLLGLYGETFIEAYPMLMVLLAAAVMEGMATSTYQVVQSQERMWVSLFGIALPRDLLLVGGAYVLAVGHGGLGLATAFALAAAGGLVATVFAVRRIGLGVSVSTSTR
jgi:O-antigen/teichoic acid export membrane protein